MFNSRSTLASSATTPSASSTFSHHSSSINPNSASTPSATSLTFSHNHSRSSAAPSSSSAASFLQRQPSTISVDMPVATSSVVNKAASRSASLYQNCLEARALMRRVPGFESGPWITAQTINNSNVSNSPTSSNPSSNHVHSSSDSTLEPHTPRTPHTSHSSNPLDPVTQTLEIIRLGSSLCYLYNAILRDPLDAPDVGNLPSLPAGKTWKTIKPLQVIWTPREDLKGCQKSAAHFIMALKTELGWGTEIDDTQSHGLMVNMLYDPNTNATVKVISNVLRLLHLLRSLGVLLPPTEDELAPFNSETNAVMDDRARVVKEILDSERKYVQDLEVLQNYQRALLQREILPSDQIRALFINLDGLVDFQRRFLIGVEANARLPPDDQRFGHLFVTMEDQFACYQPFCANFASASQLAQDENAALLQVADILDPNYELPTFLIKPVQRICKYPLLLQQLVKQSNPNGPYFTELKEGLASITRVTDAVNETTRQRENELAVNDLRERVEDWKGHELSAFGQLVLEDTFTVVKNESEREYHVYLFERIILCCKEVGVKLDKKASKQSMSHKKNSQASTITNGPKRKNTQQLKGRIFIANVMSANPRPPPPGSPHNQNLLQVTWRGDVSEEYFSIKCRTEEQLKKWQAAITKAVDDALERRRRQVHHITSGSKSKMNSPLSQFPNTPQSEMGPPPPHSAGYSQHFSTSSTTSSHHPRIPEHPYASYSSGHGNGGGSISSRTFEDEEDSYQTDADSLVNGRNTPSGLGVMRTTAHRSMPAERSDMMTYGSGRARAQTDDLGSSNLSQWRNQVPTSSMPPMPRTAQTSLANSEGHPPGSLRSSTSSRHLRHKQSHEWGLSSATSASYRTEDETMNPLPPPPPGSAASGLPMSRQGTANSQHHQLRNSGSGVPMFRSRSASSPNIHQNPDGTIPSWSNGSHRSGSDVPSVPQLPTHNPAQQQSQSGRGYTLPNGLKVAGVGHTRHRSGDSSLAGGTDRSSTDSQRPGMASTVPNGVHSGTSGRNLSISAAQTAEKYVPSGGVNMNGGEPSTVRFKLRSGEDTYVIVTLSTIGYDELIEKITKKLKNCGARRGSLDEDSAKMKIRYEDEEGDLILICNDEDIGMAIEWMKSVGISHLLLFVD